jgi:hypothetical protein
VLHLVDCSLLVPPRPGPDGRSRYLMLETLRAYGTRLLAQAGEQDQAEAVLARYAVGVAEEAEAGLQITAGELAAARRLDAEDATMAHVLGWAVGHDLDTAVRLVTALSMWWVLRGRLAGQEPLPGQGSGAAPGSELAQVKCVGVAGQPAVSGQESGEGEPFGVGEGGLDRGERGGWGGSGHRAPPGRAGTGTAGPDPAPAVKRKPTVSRPALSRYAANERAPEQSGHLRNAPYRRIGAEVTLTR